MIQDRIKAFRRVRAGDLIPNASNWRTHPDEQRDAMQAVLERIGYAGAVIAREREDGALVLIDGHLRKELDDEQEVPTLITDLTEQEARELLAVFDPLSAMAEQDDDILRDLLAKIDIEDGPLADMIAGMEAELPDEFIECENDADFVPEPPIEPITKPGDLWILGDHRLLCGDSTKAEDVARLMDGEESDVVFMDPPYGIKYKSGRKGIVARSIIGDEDTGARDAVIRMQKDGLPIACYATWRCTPPIKPRGQLIWDKGDAGGMGDLSFPWSPNYEVVWIFGGPWKGHRGSSVLRAETVVTWNTGRAKREHPHQKSIGVAVEIIAKSTGLVFDPFLGSGTTLIACQQLGRRCFGMEISCAYSDVICRRWMEYTRKEPVLESTGETFSQRKDGTHAKA